MAESADASGVRPGFLVGVLVVVFLLAAAATLFLPNLLAADLCSNETAAIAILRNLAACQEQYRIKAASDRDGDGLGEFGSLRDLAGTVPPILTPAMAGVTTEGWVEKSHYAFAVFLPRSGGGWLRETGDRPAGPAGASEGCSGSGDAAPGKAGVSATGTVDPDLAEREWVAVAWPRMIEERTRRVFLVTAKGEVFQCANARGVFCATVLPEGPADVLPPGWMPGEPVRGPYASRDGEAWKTTN